MSRQALDLIEKIFVNNGEYNFEAIEKGKKFAKELLDQIEDTYSFEGYHHKYETLEEFIHSHHADNEAYWLYDDKYSEQ